MDRGGAGRAGHQQSHQQPASGRRSPRAGVGAAASPWRVGDALAAPAPVDVDASDIARIEEMLVTGEYAPSHRVRQLEALLSREVAMWSHVVVANRGHGGGDLLLEGQAGRGGRESLRGENQQLHAQVDADVARHHDFSAGVAPLGRSDASSAALSALIAINAQRQHEQRQSMTAAKHTVMRAGFSPPSATAADPASFAPTTHQQIITAAMHHSPPPHHSWTDANLSSRAAAPARGAGGHYDDDAAASEKKLRALDDEVAAVDAECRALVADLAVLQVRQEQHQQQQLAGAVADGDQTAELFTGVQLALERSQERRAKLVSMKHALLQQSLQR